MLTGTQAEQRQSFIDTKTEENAYTSTVSILRDVAMYGGGPWMHTGRLEEAREYEARVSLNSSARVLARLHATEMRGSPHGDSIDIALKDRLAKRMVHLDTQVVARVSPLFIHSWDFGLHYHLNLP